MSTPYLNDFCLEELQAADLLIQEKIAEVKEILRLKEGEYIEKWDQIQKKVKYDPVEDRYVD